MKDLSRTPYGRAASRACTALGLTDAEAAALVRGDPERCHIILGINALLGIYSDPLRTEWMTIPNTNPRIGGSVEHPVRPVDHAINVEGGLEDVWRLLRGYAEGK